jgi:hypothetical protein
LSPPNNANVLLVSVPGAIVFGSPNVKKIKMQSAKCKIEEVIFAKR